MPGLLGLAVNQYQCATIITLMMQVVDNLVTPCVNIHAMVLIVQYQFHACKHAGW